MAVLCWMLMTIVALLTLATPLAAGETKPGASSTWENTVAAAKREGQLVFYGSDKYDLLFREFQKKFPEIKVGSVIGIARDYSQRMLMERRAGRYLVDLYINGASSGYSLLYRGGVLDPIKSALLLPEVIDESKWWQGRHEYKDDERRHLLAYNAELQPYFSYHTKLVNSGEIRSFWDLLDPKWKGKMVMFDPLSPGAASALRFIYHNPELGPVYLKRLLSEMDIVVSRDVRQIGDWLASGKYALCLFTDAQRIDLPQAKAQGLPVDWFGPRSFKEGAILAAATGVVGLINRAPHPNAARIAINWLLSREGQILYQKIWEKADSLRIDIPKDDVPSYSRRVDGVRSIDTDRPEWMDMTEIHKLVRQARGQG
jgi:ABC-type Fe3+ transport system substrate-binding protein